MANIILWTLQTLLALHTLIGAGWKTMNAAQSVPSLAGIPPSVWTFLIGIEVVCAIGLVIPALAQSLGYLVPVAAAGIALEMLVFCGVQLQSGNGNLKEIVYWLGVTLVCALIIVGRQRIAPL